MWDKITTNNNPAQVEWRMVTKAVPSIKNNKEIELSQNGKKLIVKLSGVENVKPNIYSAQPNNNYEDRNDGISIIGFLTELAPDTSTNIAVELIPTDCF